MRLLVKYRNLLVILLFAIIWGLWLDEVCAMGSMPKSGHQPSIMLASNNIGPSDQNPPATETTTTLQKYPAEISYCPLLTDLVKRDLFWYSKDNSWRSYTQSFSSAITTFVGAQWEGVKLGKVFCLYLGNEQFAFPIALEQLHSRVVLEPNQTNWSAKIDGGYKACKSSNVVDCPFVYQPAPDTSHIYDEIKYMGGTRTDE